MSILGNNYIWPDPEQQRATHNTNQLEFKFFWPLTEQISLDLDFTGCEKENNYTFSESVISAGAFTLGANYTTASISAGHLQLDIDKTTIKTDGKPPLIRRVLYKLLGLKWTSK